MSDDYGPAEFHRIPKANYSSQRMRRGNNLIVVHVSGGSAESAFNTFSDEDREASYHYIIDFDGTVWQFVREADVAWHAGWWNWNRRSFGVALAGSLSTNEDKTPEMYDALARLIVHLCRRYRLPITRQHIKGHFQAPGCDVDGMGGESCHSDPGDDFDWRHLITVAREYRRNR